MGNITSKNKKKDNYEDDIPNTDHQEINANYTYSQRWFKEKIRRKEILIEQMETEIEQIKKDTEQMKEDTENSKKKLYILNKERRYNDKLTKAIENGDLVLQRVCSSLLDIINEVTTLSSIKLYFPKINDVKGNNCLHIFFGEWVPYFGKDKLPIILQLVEFICKKGLYKEFFECKNFDNLTPFDILKQRINEEKKERKYDEMDYAVVAELIISACDSVRVKIDKEIITIYNYIYDCYRWSKKSIQELNFLDLPREIRAEIICESLPEAFLSREDKMKIINKGLNRAEKFLSKDNIISEILSCR